jgi:hypothetical protein
LRQSLLEPEFPLRFQHPELEGRLHFERNDALAFEKRTASTKSDLSLGEVAELDSMVVHFAAQNLVEIQSED